MRISDWSSDVCSSDLIHRVEQYAFQNRAQPKGTGFTLKGSLGNRFQRVGTELQVYTLHFEQLGILLGDRKRVVWGKRVSVRVDLGGRSIIKKKTKDNAKITRHTVKQHKNKKKK